MGNTYPEKLAEWVRAKKTERPCQDKHVVAFLAVRADVQAALDAGYAMKTIWEHMRESGRLQCRYETFTQHVRRYIKHGSRPAVELASTGQDKAARPATKPVLKLGGFSFDATPNKDDLL